MTASYWDWAVAVHGRDGVDAALTELQDSYGQCVSYLLWAGWAAAAGRALDETTLARGAALAAHWEDSATGPLRLARRALKIPAPPIQDDLRLDLREEVRKAEFAAERLLMDTLEEMAPPPAVPPRDIGAALVAAMRAWRAETPEDVLHSLAAKLG